MPRSALASWCLLMSVGLFGCAENSMVLKKQVAEYKQQTENLTKQMQQSQERAVALDKSNQQLSALLATTEQSAKVDRDQLAALRDQLRTTNLQLAQARSEKTTTEEKVKAMNASLHRQSGVTITPNNSFLQTLPTLAELPQGYVRRDGDVIRVTLPGRVLFEPGSARLTAAGAGLVTRAGAELLRLYPDQMIGVEGYTDTDPVVGNGPWRNNQEVSVARSLAVYDTLTTRSRLQQDQLFVVGHGAAQPIASNATPDGKEINRRVELVVYPERRGQGGQR